ncbi:beta glucosidase 17 [Perilla frutescens var. hirtella]|uniref:Beta glucosidase 17 n=1 Tax=Perilla frutescens var. hirtella TaxID=608512 RepID=A0AAD4NZB3_PERFH|nr:beta glucosidase 17 [Perilla frutescens var. frutescens]KAH6820734.1 beta glucosidase 17 [Perilla frutescens var. hirtella]
MASFQVMLFWMIISGTALGIVSQSAPFSRSSFPPDFVFGAASSSYQYEGAAFEGGKGQSIWDTYTHKFPEKIADKSNADVANDFYHRYKDDVKLLKYIGLDAFRFSIAWPRILPSGKLRGGVNKEGIAFYNNVTNELLANGITPFVTLFHWDLPQALEDEYRGFLSPLLIDDYLDFVDVCFKEFGDRIKYWITFNEPFTFISGGYDGGFIGNLAPGRCSPWGKCPQGDAATEPYVAAHHLLLSHAAAVKLYKDKYQAKQKGEIGISFVTHWFVPYSNSTADVEAAQRAIDFVYGWFIHPVVYGEYPKSMQSLVGSRLPKFTDEQTAMLKGSYDFMGLNYYTGNYAAHLAHHNGPSSSTADKMCNLTTEINGVPIGGPTGVPIFFSYPKGLHDLLVYTKKKYNDPKIYITENGMGDSNINVTASQSINDPQRIAFYNGHIHAVQTAIAEGVDVKGFIAWSFLDNFEWGSGYTQLFGLCYVDRKHGLKRIPKKSAEWFRRGLIKK